MAAAEDVYKQKFKELEENKKAELQIHELQREVSLFRIHILTQHLRK